MIASRTKLTGLTVALSLVSCFGFTSLAGAVATTATAKSSAQSVKVQAIASTGDAKIATRLTALSAVSAKVNTLTHVSAANKTSLQTEITSAVSGLNAQKTTLDAATTPEAATTAKNAIFTDYRVFAVVLPKVRLVTLADDEMNNEAKLTAFANALSNKGADSSKVAAMKTQISAAQSLSMAAETKVLAVQPADFNTDHTVLKSQLTALQQAHADNKAAYQAGLTLAKSVK